MSTLWQRDGEEGEQSIMYQMHQPKKQGGSKDI